MSFQRCPICDGNGQIPLLQCPVCLGMRIIDEKTGQPPTSSPKKAVSDEDLERIVAQFEEQPVSHMVDLDYPKYEKVDFQEKPDFEKGQKVAAKLEPNLPFFPATVCAVIRPKKDWLVTVYDGKRFFDLPPNLVVKEK